MPERVTESAGAESTPPPAPRRDESRRDEPRRDEPRRDEPRRADTRRDEPMEPDSQLAVLPAPMLASEPDLDELDAAAYAAAHGMPPPNRGRRDGRDGRENRDGRDGRDNRDGRNRDGGRGQGAQGQGGQGGQSGQGGSPPPVADPALQAEGYKAMERVFLKPGAVTRWPLYLRQAKAVLRAGDEGFDERKFGFAGLVEALRFGQREGLFRLDRDRQGVLRVYPGQLLQRAEGSGAIGGADAAPSYREAAVTAYAAPAPAVDESTDVAEAHENTAAPAASARAEEAEAPAPVAKATKRRSAATKKAAPAKRAAAPKGRAAKAPAAKKRAAKKAD
jgi:hypothetical protein